jgi:hypothetical protein
MISTNKISQPVFDTHTPPNGRRRIEGCIPQGKLRYSRFVFILFCNIVSIPLLRPSGDPFSARYYHRIKKVPISQSLTFTCLVILGCMFAVGKSNLSISSEKFRSLLPHFNQTPNIARTLLILDVSIPSCGFAI